MPSRHSEGDLPKYLAVALPTFVVPCLRLVEECTNGFVVLESHLQQRQEFSLGGLHYADHAWREMLRRLS